MTIVIFKDLNQISKKAILYIYPVQEAFRNTVDDSFSFLKDSKLLLAISGGVDSVVLAWLCKDLGLDFSLAHCNFNLRGDESDADENFVMDLADELNTEVFIQNFDTQAYAEKHKRSIQMAARELRYDWLKELSDQLGFNYILTAHHADDNLETFLINFTRGTGLNGLTGIPVINDHIVRPLLLFSRADILKYARDNHVKWREDSSNSTRKYLRNKLRLEVVPVLKEINPQLLESFQNTLENLKDTADIVDESLNAVSKRAIVDITENHVSYKVSEFKKVNNSRAYLFEMFKSFGFTEWNDVTNLLEAESGKYVASTTHKLTKHRDLLILSDLENVRTHESVEISKTELEFGKVQTEIGTMLFEDVNTLVQSDANTICIDRMKLWFPLVLRPWRKGDFFFPLGMKGKKKVKKYLRDEKLSPQQKANTWVLTSNKDIIWVVGMRADERFKITETTKSILKISIH